MPHVRGDDGHDHHIYILRVKCFFGIPNSRSGVLGIRYRAARETGRAFGLNALRVGAFGILHFLPQGRKESFRKKDFKAADQYDLAAALNGKIGKTRGLCLM